MSHFETPPISVELSCAWRTSASRPRVEYAEGRLLVKGARRSPFRAGGSIDAEIELPAGSQGSEGRYRRAERRRRGRIVDSVVLGETSSRRRAAICSIRAFAARLTA
jgi:hypothetical protein